MTKNKQKIFQLISSVNLGGAENVAFNLSEYCMVDGIFPREFTIVELYRSNTDYSNAKRVELEKKKINTVSLFGNSKRLSLFFAPFVLLWTIKKEKPSIIHSHTDLPDLVLASTIRLMRVFRMRIPEIIRTIHNTELWPTHPSIAQYTESAFKNDVIVGVSKAALKAYYTIRKRTKLNISPTCQVVYNGCNLPVQSEIELALHPNKINIAFCGRFEHQKGIDILINRIKSINRFYKDQFHFYFIGSGQFEADVYNLTNQYDNVFIHEAIPGIADKLHNFDFILMPSRFEGLPLISIESSFSKVPVIASKAPGLNETLPLQWPLWFDLNSEEELMNIFGKIVNKDFDTEKLKEEAFCFVNKHFTLSSMIREYNEVYTRSLLNFEHKR